ncbi:very large membrane protein [Cryptosporidium felis]|nr:very large membrane protein [Cryptosporidium felis]
MSFGALFYERGGLELLQKIGVSKQEVELLDHINGAVRDITTNVQEGEVSTKVKGCKELLQLVSAIRQDILGDFPLDLLILNLKLWELLINTLNICCCDSKISSRDSLSSFYDGSSTGVNIGSSCCIVLRERILDLLAEMVEGVNKITERKVTCIPESELFLWISRLTEVVIPNLVTSSIKTSVTAHCDCKIEPLIPATIINNELTPTFSESFMKENRLWRSLYRLLVNCNSLNKVIFEFKKRYLPAKSVQNEMVDFSVDNLRFLDSAQRLCSVYTNFSMALDIKGHRYFSLLAFGDIFSQFIKYIFSIYRIVYFNNVEICNTKLNFILNQKFNITLDPIVEYSNGIEISEKVLDFVEMESIDNIQDISDLNEATISGIRYNSYGSKLEEVNDTGPVSEDQKGNFETCSLMSCIIFLLSNENIIEVDSLRTKHEESIRFTILDVLESLFQSSDLETLDSITTISKTLSVYDYISSLNSNLSSFHENYYIDSETDHLVKFIEGFIKSPSHTVALILYIIRLDISSNDLKMHLRILLESLLNLKKSPFENLVPITLGYLFDLISQEDSSSCNISILFDIFKEKISDEGFHAYSPLVWINRVIAFEGGINQYENNSPNVSRVVLSIRDFLRKWKEVSEAKISASPNEYSPKSLRGIRRCILLCSVCLNSSQEELEQNGLTDIYFVSLLLRSILRVRSYRRSATNSLIDLLGNNPNFPKEKLNIEKVLDNQDSVERIWNLNTRHIFLSYFTLVDLSKDGKAVSTNSSEYNEFTEYPKVGISKTEDFQSNEGASMSVFKTPDTFHLSKLLSVIKNSRIQTQIKITALSSLAESLTSSKIECSLFCIYVDELVKILLKLDCRSFCINSNFKNQSDEEPIFGISELLLVEENSFFYHLSVALNALFISRSYKKDLLEYLADFYSIPLIRHLSFWCFSSSEDCRCSSYSLLTTILIIILKTGIMPETSNFTSLADFELDRTTTFLSISASLQNLFLLPTSTVVTNDFKELFEEELNEKNEFISVPKIEHKKISGSPRPLISRTSFSQSVSKILWDLDRLFRKSSYVRNQPLFEEVILSIFSLTFPWTRMTSRAVHFEKGVSMIRESIESIISKSLLFLSQNSPEYLSEIVNYVNLSDVQSRNLDIRLLAILKVIHSVLTSIQVVSLTLFTESLSRYSRFLILIVSYFNSYFREHGGDYSVGTFRPRVSFGIFDTITLCLESCNGAICDQFFNLLPNNIHWSFIVLQVPKLIDPLNPIHPSTSLLLVAKLLSKLPIERWFREDPRYTVECLKMLLYNENLLCNKEASGLVLSSRSFQDSFYLAKVLSIFEKISISDNSSHPLNIFSRKNLLVWLLNAGLTSSSLEIRAKIWTLKLVLFDKWASEFSQNTYTLVSNLRIPEDAEAKITRKQITWGFLFLRSVKNLSELINNICYSGQDKKLMIESSFRWKYNEYLDCLTIILRFLEAHLNLHYQPICKLGNLKRENSNEEQLVITTFGETIEVLAEEVVPVFLSLLALEDGNLGKEELLLIKPFIGFFCKTFDFLPHSSPIFRKLARNSDFLSTHLIRVFQSELDTGTILLQIRLLSSIIAADQSCFGILQNHIVFLLQKIQLRTISFSNLKKLISILLVNLCQNLQAFKGNENIVSYISIFHAIISRFSEFLPILGNGSEASTEEDWKLTLDELVTSLTGLSLLLFKLLHIISASDYFRELDSKLKGSLFLSTLACTEFISKIIIRSEILTGNFSLDLLISVQEVFTLLVSSLSRFKVANLNPNERESYFEDALGHVKASWRNFNILITFFKKIEYTSFEDIDTDLPKYLRKGVNKELKLCAEYFIQLITSEAFTEIMAEGIHSFDPECLAGELRDLWLFIDNLEYNSKVTYTALYYSTFLYKIKVSSSKSSELGSWNRSFNRSCFRTGLLDMVFLNSSQHLTELREVSLGDLRSCTIASLRAIKTQSRHLMPSFKENVFLTHVCSLYQFLKILGLFLTEFEEPINILTNKKVKPLLSFTLEALALLSSISKQLDAELERKNLSGYDTCIKSWWGYTCKVTGDNYGVEPFSYILTQVISLALCCSSLIIPVSETQITHLIQGPNPVPLSDLARSQRHGAARLHDLFLNLLDTESSVGLNLKLTQEQLRLPIEINEENGSLMSNVTQVELRRLDGKEAKTSTKKGRFLLDSIVLNDSTPTVIKCGVLRLFLTLILSSSKKKFVKQWRADELPEKLKILDIFEKVKLHKNSEFLVLSLALLEALLSYNPNPVISPLNLERKASRIYSDSQCKRIAVSLELLQIEADTFRDLDPNSRIAHIIQDLFKKCFSILRNT